MLFRSSDPANPQRVGGYATSGYAYGVAVSGNYAYVADHDAGLQVINVSNPANPQRVGGYATSGGAMDVAVSGNYVYVAAASWGLMILGPRTPRITSITLAAGTATVYYTNTIAGRPTPWSAARTSPPVPGSRSGRSRPPVTALPRQTLPPAATSATTAFAIGSRRWKGTAYETCPAISVVQNQPRLRAADAGPGAGLGGARRGP